MKKVLLILLTLAMVFAAGGAVMAAQSEADKRIAELMAELNTEKGAEQKTESTPVAATVIPVTSDPAVETPAPALAGRPKEISQLVAGASETHESLFVTVDWLLKNLANVIVVDTRPESLYVGGHVQGAVNATWTYFANMNAPVGSMKYGTLWAADTMAKRVGALGINGKKMIVIYDDGAGWGQAGYVTTIMRMCGIKEAKILEGGILAWRKAGGKISTTKHANKAIAFSLSKYEPHYVIDTKWIDNNIGKLGFKLIDVRTPQEYQGSIRPFGEKRGGHLPSAINIPMGTFTTSEFTWKTREEIQGILAQAGVQPDDEIVLYDTAGVRAANVLMMLRYAGYPKSRFYDEGYQAWAGDATLEIAQ